MWDVSWEWGYMLLLIKADFTGIMNVFFKKSFTKVIKHVNLPLFF